jgi:hypothetical protein
LRSGRLALGWLILGLCGCAATRPPDLAALASIRAARSYAGSLRVSVDGPELRGRAAVVLAARRPDALRVELPGPGGPRLVVVARDGRLCAVFPRDRAVLRSPATADDLRQLLGVALDPAGGLDLLRGQPPADARDVRLDWGPQLPRRVRARLPDGGRVDIRVDGAELEASLASAAFDEPPTAGFREIDAAEARRLWSGR